MPDPAEWSAVDHYLTDLLCPPDEALAAALRDSDRARLPGIQVPPTPA